MTPHSSLMNTYRELVTKCRERIDAALPEVSYLKSDSPSPTDAVGARLNRQWRTATGALDALDTTFEDLGESLVAIYTRTDLNDRGQADRVQQTVTAHRATFDQQRTTARTALTRMLDDAARAAMPQRPQPEDALQEARIAGIKSDLTMLLASRKDLQPLGDAIDDYLARAISQGDQLAVWVVTGSGWLDLYVRSRGESPTWTDAMTTLLDTTINRRLDAQAPSTGDDLDLRALYRSLSDPQRGAPCLLTVLQGFADSIFDELARWSLTANRSVPTLSGR